MNEQQVRSVRERLQDTSGEERARALAELYPSHGALLITWSADGEVVRAANRPGSAEMFVLLLQLAEELGNGLGLSLQWRPRQRDGSGLVLANQVPQCAPPRKPKGS